ncbi:LrgB family protein [Lentibacillus cibarius]|uniref:LrgB family protein n=1 Tax=Lentibacillus cibarius TaxID=2583219 RepID=A0A5S3R7S7_9BACI|nr:LrgB family protein [Lentibacillus cibarius]TMN22473.1 LrgB family protein [Lentibacillus cibarius]
MQETIIGIVFIIATVLMYLFMSRLYHRFRLPILIPALTTTFAIVLMLLLLGVPYDTYMIGGQWIDTLLGPAIVSLAYPLYKQRHLLVKNLYPILGGVVVGSLTGISSGLLLAQSLGFKEELLFSLLPKSVTTPVAMQIADGLGGLPSLAVLFVMTAGFTGVVVGPYILHWFRLDSSLAKGMAFGSASHAIGTSKAVEYGEYTTSVSSVAMTLSAIACSVFGPLIVLLFYA